MSLQESQDKSIRELLSAVDCARSVVKAYPDRDMDIAGHHLVRAAVRIGRRYAQLTERKPQEIDERLSSTSFARGEGWL